MQFTRTSTNSEVEGDGKIMDLKRCVNKKEQICKNCLCQDLELVLCPKAIGRCKVVL